MKLDFKFDWEVLLEFELNEVTLCIMLLGIEHNILIAKARDYDCNAWVFTSYGRDGLRVT